MINQMPWTAPPTGEPFPDPFMRTSPIVATTITMANLWVQHVVSRNGTYRAALRRVVSYFANNGLQIGDADTGQEERDKALKFFNDVLKISQTLNRVGMNFMTYGNVFTSVVMPFRRYLICPHCHASHPLATVYRGKNFNFKWQNYEFHATCVSKNVDGSQCGYRGPWIRDDRRSLDDEAISIKFWPPNEIHIDYEETTDHRRYSWKIPEHYRRSIREGRLSHLERANWEIIECVRDNEDLEFAPKALFHLYEDPLAGFNTGGWGISPVLANFEQARYLQILKYANEAIAKDSVTPLRIISPAPRSGGNGTDGDPLFNTNLGGFMGKVRKMLRDRRFNPTEWYTIASPVQAQTIGGDAKNLAPTEMIDQALATLLNDIGVPAEFFKGTLAAETAKLTLRVFEGNWAYLVVGLNRFLQETYDWIAAVRAWEPLYVCLSKPTYVDDIQDQTARMQLMMGGKVSETDGLKPLGLEPRDQQKKILDEQRDRQEMQAKVQKEMQQAASMEQLAVPPQAAIAGGPQQAGAGGAAGPQDPAAAAAQGMQGAAITPSNMPKTPAEMLQQAQIKAQEFMQMTDSQRFTALRQLEEQDETLHGLVKEQMDKMRRSASSQGRQMVLQQQFGQGGAPQQ